MVAQPDDDAPEPFRRACESLRAVRLRPEVVLDEAPAPQRLAPWAVALTGDVVADPTDDTSEELASGRFVLLHDPAGHETWNGTFRVVTFVRATVEPEVAADPMLSSVGWSWLMESLEGHGASYTAPSGTVTRVASESFGAMSDREPTAEVEIRASWTATDSRLGPHLEAWADLLATTVGLPPLAPGVIALPRLRRGR
jgi:Protein of unknown function (DUF3000)